MNAVDHPARCFEHLQVIRDAIPRSGAVNMALDEVLLSGGEPLLRLYTWAEPTVSFGYFVPAQMARQVARGRQIVRRWTGGGIVEHGEDLTYSLCVPRSCAFVRLRSVEAYRRIHAAVAHALRQCGTVAEHQDDPGRIPSPHAPGNVCFERPVRFDLLANGRKIAGAAQRRVRAGLLHQGSVLLTFGDADARSSWRTCLDEQLPCALSVAYEERILTADEVSRANALAAVRYDTAAWTDRV